LSFDFTMPRFSVLMIASSLTGLLPEIATCSASASPWVADQGDGTYRNPVLHADYSDPDAIRVGDDYWMTASSFGHVPGLPILHSRDLVNWTLVNHALPALVPAAHFARPRHGEGVWAPALRHHAGRFWIFYPDPDFGLYVITADDPRGNWSEPYLLKAGRGLIDSCPLWDEDGRAWLIHGWAKSRAGINNRLTLHEMSPDGKRLLDEGRVVIDGDQLPGWRTLEGPKLYKRDGWYYVFAPAGGVAEGYQAVFRSRAILGPYENRIVLAQGGTPVNGPHQGAWVTTPGGQDWFFHFQEMPAHGRVVHLQPMRWRSDGWPVMGDDADGDGTGEPVLAHAKPDLPWQPAREPATSDDFAGGRPGRQWQWQGNPDVDWILPRAGDEAGLRLRAVPSAAADSLWLAPNLLMQKFPAPAFAAETTLAVDESAAGVRAGLIVFGYDYGWIGLCARAGGGQDLVQVHCARADKGGGETVVATLPWSSGQAVELRVEVEADLACRFYFRPANRDSAPFVALGAPFTASSSRWVGAKVGVFCRSTQGATSPAAHADFGAFSLRR
jgi:hypothetical protein